ncbi:hypothetical protein [Pseudoalteromonas sp. SWN166]|uniref:hypothetical protein n=1 Tax=Pseudoalteromonas sp. SWN166 TaxID=2792061 RepID=UPI0018CCED4D|nr:hypothetical protein [Pseudoalteromonas sp. SWN166]MBH0040417.1 hypothetical protein [Pseudoalteromonas sp. SWN166]
MEDKLKEKSVVQKFFGEYSWMYKASAFLAFIMVFYISFNGEGNVWTQLVNGDFNSALLVSIVGYLSEFRYQFIKEARND